MRTVNFRNDVLHGVAHKLGLDPSQSNFLTNEAIPIGQWIDQWVRRTYDARDWPEWTATHKFAPSASHIVRYDAVAIDLVIPPSVVGTEVQLGRILKVFLIDPNTTDAPIDTPFTLMDDGIHVGYEHGQYVWIRYIAPPPRFTAIRWQSDITYQKDDTVYSYTSGECYRSKVSGNINHDPSRTFSDPDGTDQQPNQLPTELTVPLTQGNPGIAEQSQIVDVIFNTPSLIISDPPAVNTRFFVEVVDVAGALLGNATNIANGTDTLAVIMTDLQTQLAAALTGFTVTVDTLTLTIRIEDNSQFKVNQAFWGLFTQPNINVPVRQIQAYIAAVADTATTRQVIEFTLTVDDVIPGATYSLTFRGAAGEKHTVTYVATDSDNAEQILSSLIAAITVAADTDDFFVDVWSELNTTSLVAAFSTSTPVSIDAVMTLPGSPWWELVPFPRALADQVIRGAYADLLREWGQADKGAAEEQAVPQETQTSESDFDTTPNPPLTGQQRAISRYRIG